VARRARLSATLLSAPSSSRQRISTEWSGAGLTPCQSCGPQQYVGTTICAAGPVAGGQSLLGRWRRNDQHDQRRHADTPSRPLTCSFAPLAGLEPATYGLEVRHAPSARWCPGASPQVGSGSSSNQCHRGRLRDNDRIATGIACLTTGPRANVRSDYWTAHRPDSILLTVRCRGRGRRRPTAARRRQARFGSVASTCRARSG
jgi:hypothetical protein